MRELTLDEMAIIHGGATVSGSVTVGTDGVTVSGTVEGNPENFGDALIDIYEGAVQATSYVIERVAEAF